jgi:hypothetical protein
MPRWTTLVRQLFDRDERILHVYAYDWMGRHFALDDTRRRGRDSLVLLLDPSNVEILELDETVIGLHETELVEYRNDLLASAYHAEWLATSRPAPKPLECVGYREPLFEGGEDTLENLELVDMARYWDGISTRWRQLRDLP